MPSEYKNGSAHTGLKDNGEGLLSDDENFDVFDESEEEDIDDEFEAATFSAEPSMGFAQKAGFEEYDDDELLEQENLLDSDEE